MPADEIVPVPVSVTTPAPTDSFTGTSKARKKSAMQPRSPTSRQFIAVHDPSDGELSGTQSMARGFSLQEMLASGRFDRESDQINSPVLGSDDDGARLSDRPSTTPTNDTNGSNANDGQPERENRRNRWSLLAGRRGPPDGADPTAPNTQIARRIEGSIAGEPSIGPGARALAQEAVAVPQRREEFPTTAATAPASPPILKPSAPGQLMDDESPPFGNLTPDMQQQIQDGATDPDGTTIMFTQQRTRSSGEVTSVASALNGASISANGSISTKGNAGLQKDSISGNLEYVKLARTKGSRFIRASETGKRTYLAVLCGEQGERIELFTVSVHAKPERSKLKCLVQGAKNVSLSLNRTFVLPETPRT